jgi:hypothetical protein
MTLRFLRRRFPSAHTDQGIFVASEARESRFRLSRRSWRSTEQLRMFGLIEQQAGPRAFSTGKVGDFDKMWSKKRGQPVRFKIDDAALAREAVLTVHEILTDPKPEDRARRYAAPMTEEDKRLLDWIENTNQK